MVAVSFLGVDLDVSILIWKFPESLIAELVLSGIASNLFFTNLKGPRLISLFSVVFCTRLLYNRPGLYVIVCLNIAGLNFLRGSFIRSPSYKIALAFEVSIFLFIRE